MTVLKGRKTAISNILLLGLWQWGFGMSLALFCLLLLGLYLVPGMT